VSDWRHFEEKLWRFLQNTIEIKLLNLQPCKAIWDHKLYDVDPEGKVNFVISYLHGVCDGELNPELCLFRDETLFHLCRYVNSQNG